MIPFRQLILHGFQAEFGQTPLCRAGAYSVFIQLDDFAIIEISNVSVLVLGALNPTWVSTSFSLLFQEGVDVFGEETTVTRLWIVLCHLVLVFLAHLHKLVAFLHGQSNLIQYPLSC